MASASDNFNRADSSTLGANWATLSGISSCSIHTNECAANSSIGGLSGNRWTADTFGNDQQSQITFSGTIAATNHCGTMVREGTPGISGYEAGFDRGTYGNNRARIQKWSNFTQTNLIAHASQDIAQGDVILLTVVGATLTMFVNGISLLTTTDASIASGQPAVICDAGANTKVIDNWNGTDSFGSLLRAHDLSGLNARYFSDPLASFCKRVFDMNPRGLFIPRLNKGTA